MSSPRDGLASDSDVRTRATRDLGIRLMALGAVTAVVGFALSRLCTITASTSSGSACVQYGYGVDVYVFVAGLALLIAGGAVFFWASQILVHGSRIATLGTPACRVCGAPLMWIQEYRRWYCSRCSEYR